MKKKNINEAVETEEDDILPEYDFDNMPIIKRGPGHLNKDLVRMTRVTLDTDVAEVFPDDDAVNQALRTLMRLSQRQREVAPAA
ncbi:MAG: hypothetical protein SF097_05195 [Acidobacteriota bacterium]|nr:hypothetical protein [Acidobacteriota bacterium]